MTEQFILTSNDQQTQLNVRHWPCPSPKAVVQLIHWHGRAYPTL